MLGVSLWRKALRVLNVAALSVAFGAVGTGWAADHYPARPIMMTVPFTPGGGTDVVARLLSEPLAKQLGESVVIDNRAGAAGTIGTASVARASPDGYRILFTSSAPITIAGSMPGVSLQYDALKDLTPIAMVATQPVMIVVNSKSEIESLDQLVALSKSRPNGLTFGSPGNGTELHMIGELLKQSTGANLLHVPYKGGGPSITDLLAGHIDVLMVVTGSILPHIENGHVRALATTDSKRVPILPDVPTTAEIGYEQVRGTAWWGLFAPAGTPQPIIDKLAHAVKAVSEDPEFQQRLATAGVEGSYMDSAEFAKRIQSEIGRWQDVIAEAGVTQ